MKKSHLANGLFFAMLSFTIVINSCENNPEESNETKFEGEWIFENTRLGFSGKDTHYRIDYILPGGRMRRNGTFSFTPNSITLDYEDGEIKFDTYILGADKLSLASLPGSPFIHRDDTPTQFDGLWIYGNDSGANANYTSFYFVGNTVETIVYTNGRMTSIKINCFTYTDVDLIFLSTPNKYNTYSLTGSSLRITGTLTSGNDWHFTKK